MTNDGRGDEGQMKMEQMEDNEAPAGGLRLALRQ